MTNADEHLRFDSFVAIDWSGAKVANGIAVARATPGERTVSLVEPPNGAKRWTREAIADFLVDTFAQERCLCGVDFALSLPRAPASAWAKSARALWEVVDACCRQARGAPTADFYARAFVETSPYAQAFWTTGTRPDGFLERSRATEIQCAEWGLGAPQTPFKLIGAKQVGLGSLAGMRVLHTVSTARTSRFFAWPFDGELPPPARSVVVEIYPRLFLRACGGGGKKVRDGKTLRACLRAFDADVRGSAERRTWSDHETDALISAAGLRAWATRPALWQAPTGHSAAAFEGWIFGAKEEE